MRYPEQLLLCLTSGLRSMLVGFGLVLCVAMEPAAAQLIAGRPITIVVPVPPGGANDVLARLIGAKLQDSLGQAVIVLNKPGANQVIGTDYVAKAAPDGHTLLLTGTSAMAVNPAMSLNLPYDAQTDFAPISMIGAVELLLAVNPSVPASSVSDLVTRAKADPAAFMYAAGTTSFQLAVEMLKQMTGAGMTHVPYTGGARAATAAVAGEVQVIIIDAATAIPNIRAGRLKPLAAIPRVRSLPDLPDLAQAVPGYEMSIWLALFAPKGTPSAVVANLNAEVTRIVGLREVSQRMLSLGIEPSVGSPEQLQRVVAADIARFRSVIKAAGIRPQ